MLLYGDRIVGAAFHRRVIGDDEHLATRDAADARDDAGARRVVVVHLPRRERRQLEKRRAFVEQPIDAFADRHLALLAMPLQVAFAAAFARLREAVAKLGDERRHLLLIRVELGAVSTNAGREALHSPAATIGFEAALRTPPDRMHPVHLSLPASLADHRVVAGCRTRFHLVLIRHLRIVARCLRPRV